MIALVVHREKPWLARSTAWRFAERFFLMAGLLALAFAAYTYAARFIYQAHENWIFERALATTGAPPLASQKTAERRQTTALTLLLIGKITIPRLGISAIVKEGIAEKTLRLAVGHFPSTALPGQPGNVGLAAHRDSLFRRLKDVQRDDEITFTTLEGKYVYRVISFNVVNPTEVSVLAPSTEESTLTLVTCYPFYFVGHAPKRFIVRARQVPSIAQREEPSVHLSGTSFVEVVRGIASPRAPEHPAACAEPLRRFDLVTTLFGQNRASIKRMIAKGREPWREMDVGKARPPLADLE